MERERSRLGWIAAAAVLMLAACATPPKPPSPPAHAACTAKESREMAADLGSIPARGSCVRIRALAAYEKVHHTDPLQFPHDTDFRETVYLYRNAGDFGRWQGPIDSPPAFRIALLWKDGIPAGLKKRYPQFVEVVGRMSNCAGVEGCGWAPVAIAVDGFEILPTAMD